jgi:hypothetical protein
MLNNAFKTLKIPNNSTIEDIRKAYVKLVRRFPPEHFPDKFKRIKNAYELLVLNESLVDEYLHKACGLDKAIELASLLFADYIDLSCEADNLLSLLNLVDIEPKFFSEDISENLLQDINLDNITYLKATKPLPF